MVSSTRFKDCDLTRLYIYPLTVCFTSAVEAKELKRVELSTFKQVAEIIYKEVNGTVVPVQTQTTQPEGAGYRYADITLLKSLGLEPEISLAEGIRTMI